MKGAIIMTVNWDAFNHASHAPQLRSCNYYVQYMCTVLRIHVYITCTVIDAQLCVYLREVVNWCICIMSSNVHLLTVYIIVWICRAS